MDVFGTNAQGAFSMRSLTAALLNMAHVPMRLGQLGLFDARGMRTTTASVERKANTLQLVQTTPRNGPRVQNTRDTRDLVDIPTARIALEDTVTADEVQNIREFGSEADLRSVVAEVNERNVRMSNSIEATIEYHRMTAIKGIVLDANGDTLINLFTKFGVTPQAEVAFNLAAAANGALRNTISGVIRGIEDELGNLPYTDIHAMCSPEFFDAFVANPEYRAWQVGWQQAEGLAQRTARNGPRFVEYGGIRWEEYRGTVGGQRYVAANKCHIFPIGVPDNFITRYAPAEFMETVNTVGLPRYAKVIIDPRDADSKVTPMVQTQMLNICTRPRTLFQGKLEA